MIKKYIYGNIVSVLILVIIVSNFLCNVIFNKIMYFRLLEFKIILNTHLFCRYC